MVKLALRGCAQAGQDVTSIRVERATGDCIIVLGTSAAPDLGSSEWDIVLIDAKAH